MKNTYGRKSLIILLEDTETHTPDHVVQRVKYNKTQEQMGKNGLKKKKAEFSNSESVEHRLIITCII